MRLVTIASLGASAVLGLGALFVAKIALPNSAAAKVGPRPEAVGEPLVVASRAIKFGEKLDAGMLTVIKAPKNAIPQGAFTSIESLLASDKGGAPVALAPIASHEALLPTRLSGPGARATVAAEVSEGMRAYSFKVDDATGVGGHALPGDRVDVVLLRDLTPTGPERSFISYVVVQNARVLGVDLNADPTTDKPASPSTVTLETSVEDSQKLSIASTLGTLSLALRRHGEAEIADAGPLRTPDFLVGGGAKAGGVTRTVYRGPAVNYGILIIEGASRSRGGARPKPAAGPPRAAADPAPPEAVS